MFEVNDSKGEGLEWRANFPSFYRPPEQHILLASSSNIPPKKMYMMKTAVQPVLAAEVLTFDATFTSATSIHAQRIDTYSKVLTCNRKMIESE